MTCSARSRRGRLLSWKAKRCTSTPGRSSTVRRSRRIGCGKRCCSTRRRSAGPMRLRTCRRTSSSLLKERKAACVTTDPSATTTPMPTRLAMRGLHGVPITRDLLRSSGDRRETYQQRGGKIFENHSLKMSGTVCLWERSDRSRWASPCVSSPTSYLTSAEFPRSLLILRERRHRTGRLDPRRVSRVCTTMAVHLVKAAARRLSSTTFGSGSSRSRRSEERPGCGPSAKAPRGHVSLTWIDMKWC
mmetsp:Transcript_21956/g.51368  ORF Transcript_21956/g.51368 Transcript_21956/m.51368 type:complete len:245 (-) Transcript_21956:558-1292(-)